MALELVNKLPYDHPYRWNGTPVGGVKLWRPYELGADLALWLDAEDTSTITLNGSTVSQWDDKSGNARHASQATASLQPTYLATGFNSKPVVSFDGSDDELIITTQFALGETAAMVAQRSSVDQPIIEAPTQTNRGFWGSAYPGFTTHNNYAVDGGPLLSAPPNSAVTTPSLVSQTELLQSSTFAYKLGSATPGYQFLNGFIAEVVVTDTLLSTADRQKLEGYLAHKWGLTANLPISHPYKLTPPYAGEPVYDPDAQTYFNRVEGPTGDNQTLEASVKTAINDFVLGCKADGIWDAIKSSAILAGARTLAGALQPLAGTAPTNFNFVSGDYNRKTGLVGNGSTKYLNSNRAGNTEALNNQHMSVYVDTAATATNAYIGLGGDTGIYRNTTFNAIDVRSRNSSGGTTGSINSIGFMGISRNNASNFDARVDGNTVIVNRASTTLNPQNTTVFAREAGTSLLADARLAFYSIGEAIDLALLDTRVSTLMTAIDGAIP